MNNRVMRNLPSIYDEIVEVEALTETTTNEVELIEVAKRRVEDEQFIMTSSEPFIRMREKGFDIRADPSTETLDFRKQRLITRQSTRLPLTQRKVNEIVRSIVGINYDEYLDIEGCKVLFAVDATEASVSRELDETLERIIPLNMELSVARRVKSKVYVPAAIFAGREITIHPMPIEDIHVNKTFNISAFTQVNREITINPL